MEAIIARCLDNDPDKRPSARELVEFMVHLPQQLSLDSASTGTEGSNDRSSSELPHLSRLYRQGLLDAGSTLFLRAAAATCASHQCLARYAHQCGHMVAGHEALCWVICLISGGVHVQAWAHTEAQQARTEARRCCHPARAFRP